MTKKYILTIAGTHDWDDSDADRWWKAGSAFHAAAVSADLEFLLQYDPFIWSTELDGLARMQRAAQFWKWFKKQKPPVHRDWVSGGRGVRLVYENAVTVDVEKLLSAMPTRMRLIYPKVRIIAHSHGGQVALYAAAQGLHIDRLITVGTPVRADMQKCLELARPNIDKWLAIKDADTDKMAFGGQFGDGALNFGRRKWDTEYGPDIISAHGNIGHSKVLRTSIAHWKTEGWFDFLKEV